MGNTNVNGSISMKDTGPEFKYSCNVNGEPFDTLQDAHTTWPYRGFMHKRFVKKSGSNTDFDIYVYIGFGGPNANNDISKLVLFSQLLNVSGGGNSEAANKLALQNLVNGSMGTKGKVGVVYDKSSWTPTELAADFVATGFTPTLDVNGHIIINSGNSDYNQNLRIKETALTQSDPNLTIELTLTLTDLGTQAPNGLAVGKKSINVAGGGTWKQDILAQYSPAGGCFLLKKGSVVAFQDGVIGNANIAAKQQGDTVKVAYQQRKNKITLLVDDVEAVSFTDPLTNPGNNGGFQAIPNTSTPTIWNCLKPDEVITITRIRIISDTYQGGIAFFADGKNWFYHNGIANTPAEVLSNKIGLPVYDFGGSGDTVTSVIKSMPYIQNFLKPLIVVCCIGYENLTDAQQNYIPMINGFKSITSEGRIIGCHSVPDSSGFDASALNTVIDGAHLPGNVVDWPNYNTSLFVSTDNKYEDGDGGGPFRGNLLGTYFLSRTF